MFTAEEIVAATHAAPAGENVVRKVFQGVSQHSKTIKKDEIFIAILGGHFDGHQFLREAFQKGAAAAIVQKGKIRPSDFPGKTLFEVSDTLRALGSLACYWRKKFNIPILGVTGSNGKTTTKDLIAFILGTRMKVHKTSGNENNLIGLPFSVLALAQTAQLAIFEMGMSLPFEIQRLAEILQPTAGLITNIGDTHLEFMKSRKRVAKAKAALFLSLPKEGVAFVNDDDPYLKPYADRLRCAVFTYSMKNEQADAYGTIIEDRGLAGIDMRCHLKTVKGRPSLSFHLPLPGTHNAMNALAATAVSAYYGIRPAHIQQAIESFQATAGRTRVMRLHQGITIIDDSYNANPTSMAQALRLLKESRAGQPKNTALRTFAVLGDMLELGAKKEQYHQEVGLLLAHYKIDYVLTLGPLSQYIVETAKRENKTLKAFWTLDQKELITHLKKQLSFESHAVILVKGSHGMRMDRVSEALVKAFGKVD